MRNLKIIEHVSLDGVIQHSADEDDFPYSEWSAPYRTPEGRDAMLAAHGESFDLLIGRRTYDLWSGFWPKAPSSPMADRLNAAKKYVVTHSPESLEWGPFEGLGPDIVEGVRHIKSQDGPGLILLGSSTLTSTLLEHGLADEVLLCVYPRALGHGETLLRGRNPRTDTRVGRHDSNHVRHHRRHLQGRRAFEYRIVRRRDLVGEIPELQATTGIDQPMRLHAGVSSAPVRRRWCCRTTPSRPCLADDGQGQDRSADDPDRASAGRADRRLRVPQRRRGVGPGRARRIGRLDVRPALRRTERLRVDPRRPRRVVSARAARRSGPAARRYLPGTMVLETSWGTATGWMIVRDVLLIGPWHHSTDRSQDLSAHPDRLRGRARPAAHHPLRVGRGADDHGLRAGARLRRHPVRWEYTGETLPPGRVPRPPSSTCP